MAKVRPAFVLALATALTLYVKPLAAVMGCDECLDPQQGCSFDRCVRWSDGCVTCVYDCNGQRCTWDTCTGLTMCD